jgi:hypothetical protein
LTSRFYLIKLNSTHRIIDSHGKNSHPANQSTIEKQFFARGSDIGYFSQKITSY